MTIKQGGFLLVVLAGIYIASAAVRGYILANQAENYLQESLYAIARPWDGDAIYKRASIWLKEISRLKPEEIARLASIELGDLIQITNDPDCGLQQGTDSYSNEMHTYAVCTLTAKFKEKSAVMKIRLIEENDAWRINDFISIAD
ncbi:MAG: hypothetical protein ABI479_06645 [Gallionella sp.]